MLQTPSKQRKGLTCKVKRMSFFLEKATTQRLVKPSFTDSASQFSTRTGEQNPKALEWQQKGLIDWLFCKDKDKDKSAS